MVIRFQQFEELYPFQARSLNLGALRYNYLDEGQGEVLLMLHGNPTWSFYYRNLVLGLRDKYRCVVPDHIGCGFSEKPFKYNYTLSQHIENLETLVDSLQLKNITLVLHDWGGAIGMGFAVRNPEKIARIVVFNTAAFLSDHIPASINFCRLPVLGPIAILLCNAFVRGAFARACVHRERLTEKVREGYLAPYNTYANRIGILRFIQDIPMHPGIPSYPVVKSIQENLHQFNDRPMLIIWGKQDFCFNDHFLQRWKEYFPEAEVHELQDAGHYVVEDAHERIVPWMQDFIQEHPLLKK
ncbi:MAG: alpha/beta fold hydrolase [Nitrospinae bacterium]|nr:alpha/beta fold hydrolase [Nitrospinota bacterium]MDA1108207.1 alpha/beta fold hydrolase [Nitrospinota bacterium]